jgi:hypothetical protein
MPLNLDVKVGQSIYLGADVVIGLAEMGRGKVRLAITAPACVPIWREKVLPQGGPTGPSVVALMAEVARLKLLLGEAPELGPDALAEALNGRR